jgi:hypothetical protein
MSQERLNSLVVLCIEKNMIEHINIETIILLVTLHLKMLVKIVLYEYFDIK